MKISTALLSACFTFSVIQSSLAQDGMSEEDKAIEFLAIQHAISGSVSKTDQDSYSLELNDVSGSTILFSDRPDRIVGWLSTSDFVASWSAGADSFSEDPPNAVLIVDDSDGMQFESVVELSNPNYDSSKNTLKYDIITGGPLSIGLPSEFGRSTLVIDGNTGIGSLGNFGNNGGGNIGSFNIGSGNRGIFNSGGGNAGFGIGGGAGRGPNDLEATRGAGGGNARGDSDRDAGSNDRGGGGRR